MAQLTGPQGATGATGSTGATGATGPQGPAGGYLSWSVSCSDGTYTYGAKNDAYGQIWFIVYGYTGWTLGGASNGTASASFPYGSWWALYGSWIDWNTASTAASCTTPFP